MILGSRTAASVAITNYACDIQTQTKTNGEWANHAGSMLLGSLDSDADESFYSYLPMVQPATKLLQRC